MPDVTTNQLMIRRCLRERTVLFGLSVRIERYRGHLKIARAIWRIVTFQ